MSSRSKTSSIHKLLPAKRSPLLALVLALTLAVGACSDDSPGPNDETPSGSDAGDSSPTADTGDTSGDATGDVDSDAGDTPGEEYGEAMVIEADAVSVEETETGRAHAIEGLVRAEQAHRVKVVFRPDDGGTPVSTEPLDLEAGVEHPFELTVETLTDEGDRRFIVEVVHVESDTVLGETAFVASDVETAADAVIERNYYTDEANADAVFRVRGTRLRDALTAEATLDLPDTDDDPVFTAPVSEMVFNTVPISLDGVAPGSYPVTLRLLDDTEVIDEATDTLIRREAPAEGRVTKINRDRRTLLIDGEPLLPIGVVGVPPEELETIADAGFNLTVRWNGAATLEKIDPDASDEEHAAIINEYLDQVHAAGLYAFEAPPKLSEYYFEYEDPNFDTEAPIFNQQVLPEIIEHAKKHPAVIGYYSYDEPVIDVAEGVDQQAGVTEFAEIARQNDPYHPVYVLYSITVPDWPGAFDLVGRDYYPGYGSEFSKVYDVAKQSAELAHGWRMPYVYMPLFESSSGRPEPLTPAKVRAQAYLALTAGAKGMMWWMWPVAYHDSWQMYSQLADEFTDLETALLAEPPAQTIRYAQPDSEDTVKALVKNHDGKAYLIAVNSLDRPADVRFELPSRYRDQANVLFEDRSVAINDHAIEDQIEAYGRRVYELSSPWQQGAVLTLDVVPGDAPSDPGTTTNPSKNLVHNAGIERDFDSLPAWPDGWYPFNSIAEPGFIGAPDSRWAVDTTTAWEGSRSLRLEKRTPGTASSTEIHELSGAPGAETKVELEAGSYVASIYLKASAPDTSAWIFSGWGDTEIVSVGTDWQRFEIPFTLSSDSRWHFFRVYLREQGTLWIDGAQVEAGDTATDWVPGPDAP